MPCLSPEGLKAPLGRDFYGGFSFLVVPGLFWWGSAVAAAPVRQLIHTVSHVLGDIDGPRVIDKPITFFLDPTTRQISPIVHFISGPILAYYPEVTPSRCLGNP